MSSDPRPYQGQTDFQKMCALLQAGRAANNGTYYVHTGDLSWWLYYPPLDHDHWQNIYLWDDPTNPGRILGWALLSSTFDVYVQPELRGAPEAEAMYAWAEDRRAALARANGKDKIHMMWVAQDDAVLTGWLQGRGFRLIHSDVYMTRTLDMPIAAPSLPEGYTVRSSAGENEAAARAAAQYGAFESSAPFDRYEARFRRFMQSPVYDPDLDVVAAAPDGRIGAFCIAWPDPLNKVGLFEPVGTHPDFQRKGLGKAVMTDALRRLQGCGMTSANVCTDSENEPAVKLYEVVGFRTVNQLGLYEKIL